MSDELNIDLMQKTLNDSKDVLLAAGLAMKMATARITMLEEVLERLTEADWFNAQTPAGRAALRALSSRAEIQKDH